MLFYVMSRYATSYYIFCTCVCVHVHFSIHFDVHVAVNVYDTFMFIFIFTIMFLCVHVHVMFILCYDISLYRMGFMIIEKVQHNEYQNKYNVVINVIVYKTE